MPQLSKNSRLGFRLVGSTLHQGFGAGKYLIGIGDTASVVRYAWLESLKAQQQSGADAHETGHTGGQQGINNQLKYKTVSGGQGTNPWEIQWSLKHDTATGGWIVQHIVADVQGGGHYDYWEAWPVPANSHTPSVSGTDGNGVSYSDRFSGPTGTHTHASARFYEGLTLPSSFTVQPQGFPSGILRTTTTNPNLPTNNATAPNVRWWMAY
jgi:hypothetical protein